MIPFENLVFEIASYLVALAILWKLFRDPNKFHFIVFLVAIVTTATIELFGVRDGHGYYYDDFLLVISAVDPVVVDFLGGTGRDVPLVVAVAWAIIIFCFWRLGERLNIRWYLLPLVFGMLGVVLDLALDPVAAGSRLITALGDDCQAATALGAAEGVGYWVWCIPATPNHFWFGVPIQNFYGWFLVVAVFSYFLLLAHQHTFTSTTGAQVAALLGAMAASTGLFFTLLAYFIGIDLGVWGWVILGALMLSGVVALASAGTSRTAYHIDWWGLGATLAVVAVTLFLYFFYLMPSVGVSFVLGVGLSLVLSVVLTMWIMLGKRMLGQPVP